MSRKIEAKMVSLGLVSSKLAGLHLEVQERRLKKKKTKIVGELTKTGAFLP